MFAELKIIVKNYAWMTYLFIAEFHHYHTLVAKKIEYCSLKSYIV